MEQSTHDSVQNSTQNSANATARHSVPARADGAIELEFPSQNELNKRAVALAECDRLIQHFAQEAAQHKRRFTQLKTACITLGLITTLLSGMTLTKKIGEWEWTVPVVSGLTTLTTTLLSQTNAQRLWVQARNAQQRLTAEKFLYLQEASAYAQLTPDERTRCFSTQVIDIWTQGHEAWSQGISAPPAQ
ncbi:DUF4231 domain-containing protein [Leptolyngbya sp. AN02str]|uniref:DUF4231 domain-containing protein n=1 Tax=Leptolyngbya sp. AN02str TaxID=3423363 RepID=UPI003D319EC6